MSNETREQKPSVDAIKAKAPEGVERRAFEVSELRVESVDGELGNIVGHAAMFDSMSLDLGDFREKIDSGAFAESIGKDDVRALFNHDPNFVLGRNTANTLTLAEDSKGLAIRIAPPDMQFARDLMTSIERGDVSQMSFGFRALEDTWDSDEETGGLVRTLQKVQLFDVSPVTFPAYPDTDVAVRSMKAWKVAHLGFREKQGELRARCQK